MTVQHVLLTGPPGIGKTTIIKKVVETLRKNSLNIDGFYTEEVRIDRERIGFDIVTLAGERNILARISNASSSREMPKVGKYSVNVPAFEILALPVFEHSDVDLLVLDEIGKMELFSKPFLAKAGKAFASSSFKILATIPLPKSPLPLVDEIRNQENCILIQVSKENRNQLPFSIVEKLTKSC